MATHRCGQVSPQCYQDVFPYERAPKQNRVYLPGAAPQPPTNVQPAATDKRTATATAKRAATAHRQRLSPLHRLPVQQRRQTVPPRRKAVRSQGNQPPQNQVQANPTTSARPNNQPPPRPTAARDAPTLLSPAGTRVKTRRAANVPAQQQSLGQSAARLSLRSNPG